MCLDEVSDDLEYSIMPHTVSAELHGHRAVVKDMEE